MTGKPADAVAVGWTTRRPQEPGFAWLGLSGWLFRLASYQGSPRGKPTAPVEQARFAMDGRHVLKTTPWAVLKGDICIT